MMPDLVKEIPEALLLQKGGSGTRHGVESTQTTEVAVGVTKCGENSIGDRSKC